jgi:hypothetical protein
MEIFVWEDRRPARPPRAVVQRGRCDENQCGQFSISISNGERGMTVRFATEQEFRDFLERGTAEHP